MNHPSGDSAIKHVLEMRNRVERAKLEVPNFSLATPNLLVSHLLSTLLASFSFQVPDCLTFFQCVAYLSCFFS